MKRCFIFSAGSFYSLYEKPQDGDLVIAADAGLLLCKELQINPDYVMGDFDSMDFPFSAANVMRFPVEKDDTDTMLAVKKAIELGCGEIFIYGGTGGKRMDHSLANIAALAFARKSACKPYLYDDDFVYTVIDSESLEITKTVDDGLISVFAFGGDATGVYIKGAQYELENAALSSYVPVGVSNHMRDEKTVISCVQGLLLIGWQLK